MVEDKHPLDSVRDIVAVHSAKGGVGKSTTAANLAVTFARLGLDVGLLDGDVYGPSIAHMFGASQAPLPSHHGDTVQPLERHGVRFLSVANLAGPSTPIIWRGPMVSSALQQLLSLVEWGELDLLLVDLPPGTGDAILTVGQQVALSGAIIVTTPQEMSLADTRRGIQAFRALQVPILGLVENMSIFICDHCGDELALFGDRGGERTAEHLGIPLLGRIPIVTKIREAGDSGEPVCAAEPLGSSARVFESVARALLARLSVEGRRGKLELRWEKRPRGEFRAKPPGKAPTAAPSAPDSPLEIWQASDDVLGILWGDGTATFHGAYQLRRSCPCAKCVNEWTRERLPSLDAVPSDVRPVVIDSVGRYAIQPTWSDGHRTGIFSFRDLRAGAGAVELRGLRNPEEES
jgi:ATP-binding protein involved in chromosome partitioning